MRVICVLKKRMEDARNFVSKFFGRFSNMAGRAVPALMALVLAAATITSCAGKGGGKTVVIGSKLFTEGIVFAYMMKYAIEEKTDLAAEVRENLGNTFVVFEGLKSGDIDAYPDYTGTLYRAVLKQNGSGSAEEIFDYVQREMKAQYDVDVLPSMGVNSTYAVAVSAAAAQQYNLSKISDLAAYPQLRYAFDNEYAGRGDGADALLAFYGIKPNARYIVIDVGLRHQTVAEGLADVVDVYSTEPQIKRFNLTVLEDDKKFFPPYYSVAVVSGKLLREYPEVGNALRALENVVSDAEILQLSYAVEDEQKDLKETTKAFLQSKGVVSR